MKDPIYIKTYLFALRIIKLYQYLISEQKEFIISKQVLKSGTAIGALIKESGNKEIKTDHKLNINMALKEANKTDYWLSLLKDSNYLNEKNYSSIHKDIAEIIKMLIRIIKAS